MFLPLNFSYYYLSSCKNTGRSVNEEEGDTDVSLLKPNCCRKRNGFHIHDIYERNLIETYIKTNN